MSLVMLRGARWLRNHGVMLTYAGRGRRSLRFVPPNGSLSIGEATVLLHLSHTRLYRLHRSGRLKISNHGAVARVSLSELRRIAKTLR